MANSSKYEDMELTREEVDRIGTALKDQEFRKLLVDYVEELKDPENRKIFQEEIAQLEKERGNDVTFINPIAGYVIKTSVNGNKKCFVNICANEHVKKPSSSPMVNEGAKGLQWSLPHTLSPPREDLDKQGARCEVYDVVFHPDTLYLAKNNKAFYSMVNDTACEAVENNFDVKLDRKNLKFPKMQYKGMPHATVIRTPSKSKPSSLNPDEQSLMDKVFESMPKIEQQKSPRKNKKSKSDGGDPKSKYTAPKYLIKHRSHLELEEFTEHKTAKLNSATPKELVVEINLPLLKSAEDITLDVNEKTVHLTSEKPAKYKLSLTLPYSVNQDCGNAKFDKDARTLTVTLPVKRSHNEMCMTACHDSGVESDHGSPVTSTLITEFTQSENDVIRTNNPESFLDASTHYIVPDHTCHIYENILAITLHVKNVNENSLQKLLEPHSFHLKFSTTGSGFYTVHYAFYLRLPAHLFDVEGVSTEIWDNNVIVQAPFSSRSDETFRSYFAGVDGANAGEKYVEEPAIINTTLRNSLNACEEQEASLQLNSMEVECKNDVEKQAESDERNSSRAIDIVSAFSESSGDELSCSYSPKDGELLSTSLKKTVRFSEVVSRQLYRSNSSILGQKKKNQRKARNKKRAQERRHSESELSELEDRKERELKTVELGEIISAAQTGDEEKEEKNDIFHLDI